MALLPGCGSCGAVDAGGGESCAICGAFLLVDVVLHTPALSPRQSFEIARDLTARVPGLPTFGQLRMHLAGPGPRIPSVARAAGVAAAQVLGGHHVAATAEPHVVRAKPDRTDRWRLAGAGVAVLVALTLGYLAMAARSAPWARGDAPKEVPHLNAAVPLAAEEIGRRALPGVVQLSCSGKTGAGFFLDDSTVVTNEHVTCEKDEIDVRLHDGRRLLGTVTKRDRDIDLARITVVGANVPALPLGSSATLEPGERLVFIGSPAGLGFTLHDASVSFVGRPILGVAYLQMQGSINPGNSGGPVLDVQGRVVGIVTLKMQNMEGIGMALPIEYVRPPTDPAVKASWEKILAGVENDNKEEAESLDLDYDTPRLIAVDRSQGSPVAVIVQRWSDTPHGTVETFALKRGLACELKATFTTWVALDKIEEDQRTREVRWLLRHAAGNEIYVGLGALEGDCLEAVRRGQGQLALTRGTIEYGKVDLAAPLAPGRPPPPVPRPWNGRQAMDAPRQAPPPGPTIQEPSREHSWRQRFEMARARIENVDRDVERAKEEMARIGPNANIVSDANPVLGTSAGRLKQLQAVIDGAEDRKRAAEDALTELDRQASLDSVPQEWRR